MKSLGVYVHGSNSLEQYHPADEAVAMPERSITYGTASNRSVKIASIVTLKVTPKLPGKSMRTYHLQSLEVMLFRGGYW